MRTIESVGLAACWVAGGYCNFPITNIHPLPRPNMSKVAGRLPSPAPVRGLLRCLDCSFFIPSFEEEGFILLGDIRRAGVEEIGEFVHTLAMPNDAGVKLLEFAFPDNAPEKFTAWCNECHCNLSLGSDWHHFPDSSEDRCSMHWAALDEDVKKKYVIIRQLDDLGPDRDKYVGDFISETPATGVARCARALDAKWLEAIGPLYSQHMGCENMGPLLYSLVRFVKPSCCLEIGAGYTSVFLLQALADNVAEAKLWRDWAATSSGKGDADHQGWLTPAPVLPTIDGAVLHCVDNLAHEGTTAHRLMEAPLSK